MVYNNIIKFFRQFSRLVRGMLKSAGIISAILVAPLYLFLGLIASIANRFTDFSVLIGYIPFYTGEYIRYIYYKVFLKKLGKGTIFKYGSFVQYRDTSIGAKCLIGYFNSIGLIEMGDNVLCG